MDDIFVAFVFDNLLLSPRREGTTNDERGRQQYLKTFFVISYLGIRSSMFLSTLQMLLRIEGIPPRGVAL